MRAARIDHQVGFERVGLPVVARENVYPGAVALRLSRSAQRGHLGALQKGHVVSASGQLEDGGLDECPTRVELP
jgi:hypothetical protein